jgi:hypothetical protein
MGSQLDPLPLSRVGSRECASKSQLSATWLCETLKWVSLRDLGVRHVESFEVTNPSFSSVLKLVIELFLVKSVRFARYRRFGVLCLMGILTWLRLFFRYLEMTYPPIFKCSESKDVKNSLTLSPFGRYGGVWLFNPWLTFIGQLQNLKVWTV